MILDFLEEVYGGVEGWIDLPTKVNDNWVPWYQRWPDRRKAAVRVRGSLEDKEDLYFSVITFSEKGRSIDAAQQAHWLWADLDLVTPASCVKSGLQPTIAWETSKGHFQALWKLTKELDPQSLSQLNRRLTYALDADHGGWDLTQVLRLPGSRNYKYPDAPEVQVLFDDGPVYAPEAISKRLRKLVPLATEREQMRQYQPKIRWTMPPTARRLLRTPPDQVVKGERSEVLWKLECLLVEAGVPEEVIFRLIWSCAWNKHAEVNSGKTQLRREITRAIRHVTQERPKRKVDKVVDGGDVGKDETVAGEDDFVVSRSLNFVSYARFMAQNFPPPAWLVEGIWTAKSHGIIGGEPKTSKSTLALALGLSVASGRPFLGHFPVHTTGPVLVVQEENSEELVQDRLARIAASYGLMPEVQSGKRNGSARQVEMPADVSLHIANHPRLDLSDENDREALERTVKEIRPVMVILDPLYLMTGNRDLNSSSDLHDILQWFLSLRYQYGVAIAMVHHLRKQRKEDTNRAGQRILGSTTLHGWAESSLYIETMDSTDLDPTALQLRIQPETRNMAPQRPLDITLHMGTPSDFDFSAEVSGITLEDELRRAVGAGNTVIKVGKAIGTSKYIATKRLKAAGYRFEKSGAKSSVWVFPRAKNGDS